MLDKIIALDKQLLVYLNSLGSTQFDGFWIFITNQINWFPFFALVFFILYKKFGWKRFLIAIVFLALLILVADQSCNLFKYHFQRLRPCNDPDIKDVIRRVKESSSFSFYSGHATTSMATAVFVYCISRNYHKYAIILFIFPLIFAYSRIYLGLHFPADILVGYLFGIFYGYLFVKLFQYVSGKITLPELISRASRSNHRE
jgi:undecaprenyl-diphosphatase